MSQVDDIRNMEPAELREEEEVLRKEIFGLRMKLQTDASQLKDFKAAKKRLAQVLTIQTEKAKAS